EDGIRDRNVTGVQTCALPILGSGAAAYLDFSIDDYSANAYICGDMYTDYDSQRNCLQLAAQAANLSSIWVNRNGVVRISCLVKEIGRASCRERLVMWSGVVVW